MATYTDEQMKKALAEKTLKDMERRYTWQAHLFCIEKVFTYNLPYRILWNDHRNLHNKDFYEIGINPWYPLPKIPKAAELTEEERTPAIEKQYTVSEWVDIIIPKGRGYEKPLRLSELKPQDEHIRAIWEQQEIEIRNKAEAKAKPFKLWWLDDSEGIKKWEYYFTRFLVPYKNDIAIWGKFDFWGNNEHTDEETEQKRQYYLSLIADYETNPSKYDTQPHYKQLSDYDIYDFGGCSLGGYMWEYNYDDTPPAHPQALQIMYKERELEIAYIKEKGEEWEIKKPSRYSKLYRINTIIDKLEQEQGKGNTIA